MRSEIVSLLRCPDCGSEGRFRVDADSESAVEITEGRVLCLACEREYRVRDGCLDLLPHPSGQVARERAAQELVDARYGEAHPEYLDLLKNEEQLRAFVLSLPDGYPPTAEQAPVVQYAIDRLGLSGGETALDVGAGMCWTTAALAATRCRAVAVDLSELFMPRSRFFCEDGRYFDRIFGDMASIPVASGSFDVVFANAAIHHSPDLRRTIAELARILRRGGRLVFTNEPVAGPRERKRLAAFGAEAIEEGFNENIYTTAEWASAFEAAGLDARFEIVSAGISEKVKARRSDPHNSLFRKLGLFILSQRGVREVLLPIVKPFALRLYPFNVVIWAAKPE